MYKSEAAKKPKHSKKIPARFHQNVRELHTTDGPLFTPHPGEKKAVRTLRIFSITPF